MKEDLFELKYTYDRHMDDLIEEEKSIEEDSILFKVEVIAKKLNIRIGPGLDRPITGSHLYLNEIVNIVDVKKGWGKLTPGGWIKLEFTKRI